MPRTVVTTPPDNAIETEGLRKVYAGHGRRPPKVALDGITLNVPRGSFFGLLGPNGAGKSTLINVLAGLAVKTEGTARIWGFDIDRDERAARTAIGVVPQELNLDAFFTPYELLDVQAGMYGVPKHERRTAEILAAVGLADKAEAYARTLSGGMRRRLLVAKAMVHSPPVLVLDEPTAGVDIELRQQLWAYVKDLNARGTTILLTTHYLEEAEQLCDRIAIINHGRLVACDTTRNLLRRLDSKTLTIAVDRDLDAVPPPLAPLGAELRGERTIAFHYKPSSQPIGGILEAVRAAGLGIVDLTTQETDLEDIFLQLTSRKSAQGAAP
ncbi:MAG: ABC transporter ATP-binding protein [Rhodospirillales bacterium]|nr:ABC transporter ATP-binding protein [Rhodospirillales bacterium]